MKGLKWILKVTTVSWKKISNLGEKHNLDHWRKRPFGCNSVLHHTPQSIQTSGWRHDQFSEAKLWKSPPLSPDLNSIEHFWSSVKTRVHVDGRQFTTNNTVLDALQDAARSFSPYEITKYTNSINKILFEVIPNRAYYMN